MRCTVKIDQLLKATLSAGKAIAVSTPNQILTNLKLDLNDKGLEITGRNGKIAIKSLVPYMIGDKQIIKSAGLGSTLVNAKYFTDIVRKLESEEVSLDVIDDAMVRIEAGSYNAKVNCVPSEEYPDLDLDDLGPTVELRCADFAALVEQSAFAASNKDQRPILTALHLEAGNGVLEAVATDTARLARKTLPIDSDVKFVCNIAAKTALDIVRMFEGEQTVRISVNDSQIVFDFGNTIVTSRLIEGEYPDTKSIVPTIFNRYLEVNSLELQKTMELVSVLSDSRDSIVRLSMKDDEVTVSSKNVSSGSSSQTLTICSYQGERLDISFNSLFVIDALKALKTEDVTICFQGELKPFVIRNPKDDSVVELLTPMRTY